MAFESVAHYDRARKDIIRIRKSTGILGTGAYFRTTLNGNGDPTNSNTPLLSLGSSGAPITSSMAGFPVIPASSGQRRITGIRATAQVACAMMLYEILWSITLPTEATEYAVNGDLSSLLVDVTKEEVEWYLRCGSSTVTSYTGTLYGTDWDDQPIEDALSLSVSAYNFQRYEAIPGNRYKTIDNISGGLVSAGIDFMLVRQLASIRVDVPYEWAYLDALKLIGLKIRSTSALMLATAPNVGYSATTRLWHMDIEVSSN